MSTSERTDQSPPCVCSLFEEAASKLNLKALLSFLTELGESSRQQLRHMQHHHSDPSDMLTPDHLAGQGSRLPSNALHLYRLQQALMMVVHSPRPLLHLVRVWAAASPYLVEVGLAPPTLPWPHSQQ